LKRFETIRNNNNNGANDETRNKERDASADITDTMSSIENLDNI